MSRPLNRIPRPRQDACSGHRRPVRTLLATAASLLPLLFVGTAGTAESPEPGPEPSVPEKVMTDLRAAHAARTQLAKEEQARAMEKEKLELLASTVRSETERLRTTAAKAKSAEADLKKRIEDLKAQEHRFKLVEAMIDTLAERLEKALEALAARSLPGLVPPDTAADITEPPKRLAAGAGRLEEVGRQAGRSGVELVAGTLGNQSVTVRLLRVGGVAAWWMTLDGKQAGTAAVKDTTLILHPAKTPQDAAAVSKAFAIAEGRAAPDWVLLPADQVKTK